MALKMLLLVFCLFLPTVGQGIPPNVTINEVAWMGTEDSANDEWIELYNNGDEDINLEGWGLYEQGGLTLIEPLTGIIKAKSYCLVERTDDETVPDVEASQPPSSWGGRGLKNTGEHLQLLDNNSNIVDEVDCKEGWFAGKAKPEYKTMERINSLVSGNNPQNWQTSQNPGGTPKAENSPAKTVVEAKKETAGVESLQTEIKSVTYPSGVVFSEILPSPEGPDDKEEWIEIFNQNDFEVPLSNWKIKDTTGRITTFTFLEGTKISGKGYLVLLRPDTKITLNNTGDGLELLQPNGEIIDSITYEKAPFGQSYNRTPSGWAWSTTLTPSSANIIPKKEKIEAGPLPAEEMEVGPRAAESSVKKGTAAVGEKLPLPSNYPITLLVALIVSIFSAIVILILKRSFTL